MKKCKFVVLICCGLLLVGGLIGCGVKPANPEAPTTAKEVTKAIRDPNTLYFVGEEDYPPISFMENGQVEGISPEIIREAFSRMGYKVELELMPWRRAQDMVLSGAADGLFSPYWNPDREKKYLYAREPLLQENNVFFVRIDSKIEFDGNIGKMKDYTLGTLAGYETLNQYLKSGETLKLDISKTNEEALNKLIDPTRGVDAVVNTNYVLWYQAKKMNITDKVKELKTPLGINPSYLAFTKTKDMSEIADKFSAELFKMKGDDTYRKILGKYGTMMTLEK